MSKIKKIKIQNFRGVKAALQFPFLNGTNFTSLLIYGKNGTGKSSISDAWEWWYSSKIEHLAREDAGERDVINSFDAYKRPRVIDLIEEKFSDYQFLILTHDIIWFEQVARKFNRWNKLRFYGWDFENGPKLEAAKNWFERIEDDIIKDRGREAGQTLAGYLEWFLQVLNQNFLSPIEFRITNQYVLSELYDAFKKRVKDKLKDGHRLCKKLEEFESNTLFRNYCMHWKDNEYTAEEIKKVYHGWLEIENIIKCEDCNRLCKFDRESGQIKCRCGSLDLKDQSFYN